MPFGPEIDRKNRECSTSQTLNTNGVITIERPWPFGPLCPDDGFTTSVAYGDSDPLQPPTTFSLNYPSSNLYDDLSNEGNSEIRYPGFNEPYYSQSSFNPDFDPNLLVTINATLNSNATPSELNFRPVPQWNSPNSDYEVNPSDFYSSDFFSLFPEYRDNFHIG